MPELIKYVAGFRWCSGIGLCFWWMFIASCGRPIVSKAPKDTYFLYRNNIEVKGGNFTKTEKTDYAPVVFYGWFVEPFAGDAGVAQISPQQHVWQLRLHDN